MAATPQAQTNTPGGPALGASAAPATPVAAAATPARYVVSQAQSLQRLGDQVFQRVEKINSEVLALIYGSMVVQILKDVDGNVDEANTQLEKAA
eukprot:TRINITY_DN4722_c0_g1_i1.p1 TRINITY_DN4722_c0_g1~~TRINITY_DN4722_c0_g1_i1.p1  ORF type:complete len:110 (-),score=37.45 TRINITY_DN4722_c0_g1_i1:119-400(-)